MNDQSKTKYQRYDEAFKRSSVEHWLASGKSARQIAGEALKHRQPKAGRVHHSDRGVQYASAAYRQRLAAAGVQPSLRRKGNCYDNAALESFWSSLKRELVHRSASSSTSWSGPSLSIAPLLQGCTE